MYKPDRIFMKDLKVLDKRLGCKYETSHGHFIVDYKRAQGQPVPIFLVKGDKGEFRQPDKRDLDFLHSGDLTREDMETKIQKSAPPCTGWPFICVRGVSIKSPLSRQDSPPYRNR